MKPTLYQMSISPSCQRVFPVLARKGIDYDAVEVDIGKPDRPEAFQKISPFGQVPVFVHDDAVILGSANIVEYIDEQWREIPMLPRDPKARAFARQWMQFADREIQDRQVMFVHREREVAGKIAHCHAVFDALIHLERALEGNTGLFLGDALSLVDCLFAPALVHLPIWARLTQNTTFANYANIPAYVERLKLDPVLAETVFSAPAEAYEQYYSAVFVHGMTFPVRAE